MHLPFRVDVFMLCLTLLQLFFLILFFFDYNLSWKYTRYDMMFCSVDDDDDGQEEVHFCLVIIIVIFSVISS
jgi:hypothetical protein